MIRYILYVFESETKTIGKVHHSLNTLSIINVSVVIFATIIVIMIINDWDVEFCSQM